MKPFSRHGKLVRDRIPQIIREDGAEPVTYTAGREEYRSRLRDKLGEEVAEFLESDEDSAPEELADVLEVVRALAADLGVGTSPCVVDTLMPTPVGVGRG
ncbi:nucleoside triphosphate pyrophosphohydrolase [Streptomyces sp. NPDC004232]|uniref:nucleoside triphosphate pyrophosphohydrolase n=1 Tax=Streptomyces sp. NPDC004232 TaxID=3154454 RepID=UPI0033A60E37